MLDIICTLKNRSAIFLSFLKFLQKSDINRYSHNLVVVDFDSTDIDLKNTLNQFSFNYSLLKVSSDFSRAYGLQKGFEESFSSKVFFIDVDMSVPHDFFSYVEENVKGGQCIFPICYSFFDHHHQLGFWRKWGFGMCGFTRSDFSDLGGWNTAFGGYGYEDTELYFRAKRHLIVLRERLENYYHIWHPNNLKWKTRFHQNEIRRNPYFFLIKNLKLLASECAIDFLMSFLFSSTALKTLTRICYSSGRLFSSRHAATVFRRDESFFISSRKGSRELKPSCDKINEDRAQE